MKNIRLNKQLSVGVICYSPQKKIEALVNKIESIFKEWEYEIFTLTDGKKNDSVIQQAVEKAKYHWILLLEEDEDIRTLDINRLSTLLSETEETSYKINIVDYVKEDAFVIEYSIPKVRLFHQNYREHQGETKDTELIILEKMSFLNESDEEVRKTKFSQKEKDLLSKVEESPENSYHYFLLGVAYKMSGDYKRAKEALQKALELPFNPKIGYAQLMIVIYGNLLLEMEEYQEALLLENVYEYFEKVADFLCLMGRIYLKTGFVAEAIREFNKALNTLGQIKVGSNSYIPNYYLGCIYEVMGDKEIAIKLYKRCGNYNPALDRLKEID